MASFLSPKAVEQEVAGTPLKFYPNSIRRLAALKSLTSTVADAFAQLFSSKEGNSEVVEEVMEGQDGFKQHRTIIAAPSVQLLTHAAEKRRALVEQLVGLLMDETHHVAIGTVIMDSLREDCGRDFSPADAAEFVSDMDAGALIECVLGVTQANTQALGPLGKGIAAKIRKWAEAAIDTATINSSTSTPGAATESEEEATTSG